jgi:DNA repair protein RecO (recombination protein O)
LIAAWSGKSELRTLHSLEWDTGLLLLTGEPLMCGFYLNELLLRLLPKEDAHEALFDYYAQTLRALAKGAEVAPTLRRFELKLLQELGYAVPLLQTDAGALIEDDVLYDYVPEHGACASQGLLRGVLVQGRTLLAMANDDYSQVQTKVQSKQLMRMLIGYYLNDKPLHTRQLLMDLNEL